MKRSTKKILIISLLSLIILALGVRVIFDEAFDNFNNMIEARENAPDKEEFDENFEKMGQWFTDYKENNPWASDEDAQNAWDAAWGE